MKLLLVVLAVVQLILAGPLPKEYVENTPENCECFNELHLTIVYVMCMWKICNIHKLIMAKKVPQILCSLDLVIFRRGLRVQFYNYLF